MDRDENAGEGPRAFDTGKPTILMQADAIVNNLKIFELEKSLSLLEAEQVEAHNINVDAGNNVLVANMQISNLHTLSRLLEENSKTAHSLLYAGKTIVEDIALEQTNNLSIAALRFHDLAALITRNRDKTWHLINDINFAGAKELQEQLNAPQSTVITRPVQSHSGNVAENEKVKNTAPALKVKIGVAEILENSQLIFVDKSVTPVYFTKLNSLLARVENLDTDKPKQASSININAKVGKDATVVLSGRINPFAKKLSADLTGKIENFKLPPLSSYTGKNLGYTFKHGFMSADIKLKIKNGKYKMKDNVVLTNLTLVAKDSHIIERIAKQLNMPLDTALDLLRDKNNSIELSIPVRGDLKSLNSDMADVINQAVTKALNSASISYVTRVLKPFGSFTPMVTQADEVTSPQFEPVIFEAGKSELNLAEQKYLKKLAGLLVERPRIRLALCGRATETDRKIINEREKKISQAEQPLTPFNRKTARGKGGTSPPPTKSTSEKSAERLRELAKARARAVKEYFTRRHGIDAKRLLLCHPKANIVDKKARPRVDIEL